MTTYELPAVGRLNEINREWIKLEYNAPLEEKQRVFRLMRELPETYYSLNAAGNAGTIIHRGAPIAPAETPIAVLRNIAAVQRFNIRADVAWCWELGSWISI